MITAETAMPDDDKNTTNARPAGKASHGASSEVKWQSGQGRQPYANQGEAEGPEANLGNAFPAGDRGEHSGANIDQFEQVKKKP
ncbi:MAG TPA: hypothetical protein VLJ86_27980 [Ramlibacter sp.]|nr:hypothetical protein [Ramlibacter sp.]